MVLLVEDRTTVTPPDPRTHLSDPRTRAALRIQEAALQAVRDHLSRAGFTEILPPVIGPVTDPGIRGSKQVDVDYYGHRYKLMTSAILYKQAALQGFGRIFCIAPNVRLEPLETASTARHLTEFHQIDVEIAGADRDEAMAVVEDIVVAAARWARERVPEELERLGRRPEAFDGLVDGGFDRMSHREAVRRLHELGHPQDPGAEIDWAGEALLSEQTDRPFFVTDYPKGSRGFYDRESTTEPGMLRNFDLLAAEGFGELCSGSERESEFRRLVTRMRETGENPAKYGWYLDMAREGLTASSGFGIGVQRLTRYLAGLEATWQASAFPKLPGVISA